METSRRSLILGAAGSGLVLATAGIATASSASAAGFPGSIDTHFLDYRMNQVLTSAQRSYLSKAPYNYYTESVRSIQEKVGVAPDGVFGNNTRIAVIRKQKQFRINADGVVGRTTAGKLGLTYVH